MVEFYKRIRKDEVERKAFLERINQHYQSGKLTDKGFDKTMGLIDLIDALEDLNNNEDGD